MQGGKRTLHNVVVNIGMSSLATRLCKLPMAHSGPLTTVQIPTDHCFSLWFQTSPFVPKLPFPFPLCRSHWVRLLQAHQLCPLRLHLCLRHSCIQNILHSHGKSNNAPCIPAHSPPSAVSRPDGCLRTLFHLCLHLTDTLFPQWRFLNVPFSWASLTLSTLMPTMLRGTLNLHSCQPSSFSNISARQS